VNQESLFDHPAGHPQSPGDLLRSLLEEFGWTQEELAFITGTSRQTIAQIVANRSGITADMAVAFARAFGKPASEWLRLDAMYRLSQVKKQGGEIEQRAKAYSVAPVREMQKRGWIRETKNIEEIEYDLLRFFGTDSLDAIPPISVATRRTNATESALTPTQRAWCFRARELAKALQVVPFHRDEAAMRKLRMKLRDLAAYTKESRHLPKVLAQCGIRFVVVEPLPGAKIDGATFWLNENSPVMAISVRYDRIDNFWFTVMHEFSHVVNGDAFSLDIDLEGDEEIAKAPDELVACEQRANIEASGFLIGKSDMDSFIGRVAPLFSKERIVQFAHAVKIHPGIVVGQLKHRGELHPGAHRDLVSRVREVITESALTDGWGKSITESALGAV
jgi:HTH-type transcriptional regulator / antitoxin HigA